MQGAESVLAYMTEPESRKQRSRPPSCNSLLSEVALSDRSDKRCHRPTCPIKHPIREGKKKREVSVGGHLPLSCELHLACCLITLQRRSYSLLTPVLGSLEQQPLEHRRSSCGYDGYDGSYLQLKTSYPA